MKVLVTGANGFLGPHLLRALASAGHEVVGCVRRPESCGELPFELRRHALGEPVDPALFAGVEGVVHGAHDARAGASTRNVAGTQALVDAARRRGVRLQVLLGSCSAHPAAAGEYGSAKWELETFFLEEKLTVLKAGLVIGPGGLFRRLHRLASRVHVLPLIDGGRSEVPVLALHDLCTAVVVALERGTTGRHRLYLPELVPLRTLLEAGLARTGHRALPVYVPYPLAHLSLGALEGMLGAKLPFRLDSLRALRANQAVCEPSDLSHFVAAPATLAEMVARAFPDEVSP